MCNRYVSNLSHRVQTLALNPGQNNSQTGRDLSTRQPIVVGGMRLRAPIGKVTTMTHPVDVHVGKRIRHRRWMNGTTQQQLAEKVGIKFQQIQKYETGMNRVSASRLWDIADVLGVSISFFFEGIETVEGAAARVVRDGQSDFLSDREALELLRSYYAIPENQRRRLFELARVLSEAA